MFFLSFFLSFFLYLFMTVLSLRFCARAFSSCGKRGPLFIAVHGPLTIVASLVAEHRLQTRRLSNCGSRAQLLRGMWDPPGPGLEPVSPALAGRLSTTAPPGKPLCSFWWWPFWQVWGDISLWFWFAVPWLVWFAVPWLAHSLNVLVGHPHFLFAKCLLPIFLIGLVLFFLVLFCCFWC